MTYSTRCPASFEQSLNDWWSPISLARRTRTSSCREFGLRCGSGIWSGCWRRWERSSTQAVATATIFRAVVTMVVLLAPMTGRPRPSCFPSSAGFTAAVELSGGSLSVSASWGRYEKIDNPDPAATGAFERLWQRHPCGGTVSVPLVEGDFGPLKPDPLQPEVVVRGRCRRTPSCWLVTLFLVNEQLPAPSNIDERWLFQIELAAEATDGSAVFVGRDVALPDQSADTDGELRHLDLLYREKVEFAVGHGIAVHAEPSGGDPYRATSIRTSVIPRSEVAKVEAPGPDDPALDEIRARADGHGHLRHGSALPIGRPGCRDGAPASGGRV